MTPTTDEDTGKLLDRAESEDVAAVEQLISRHRSPLRQMVAVRMDQRLSRRADPSDVVQDTLAETTDRLGEHLKNRSIPFYCPLGEAVERKENLKSFFASALGKPRGLVCAR